MIFFSTVYAVTVEKYLDSLDESQFSVLAADIPEAHALAIEVLNGGATEYSSLYYRITGISETMTSVWKR